MQVTSIRIVNYKSFLSSETLEFTSGFNVIVGQNNVGKTALLEAISLAIKDKPHRSIETQPSISAVYNQTSRITVEFRLSGSEYMEILARAGTFLFNVGINESIEGCWNRFSQNLGKDKRILCEYETNHFTDIKLQGDADGSSVGNALRIIYDAKTCKFKNEGAIGQPGGANQCDSYFIANELRRRLYIFRAERLNVSQCSTGIETVLASDSSNLASVLNLLQSNPARFRKFNDFVHTIFPDIRQITIRTIASNAVSINAWTFDPDSEREDLAIPLSECGTGIGQVLAILYVVVTADQPRTIIIDEPQSFLHPGAIRKLFEILKRYPQHQFFVSTHSPTVVTAANPKTLLQLRKAGSETKTKVLNVSDLSALKVFLDEIGARLSDVFGADRILWVEGKTEEVCFRKIVDQLLDMALCGTEIIGVMSVGDFEAKQTRLVFRIYEKLSKGSGLLPPALAFCFDREERAKADMEKLEKDSNGAIHFLPRRMFENYLLNTNAIAEAISASENLPPGMVTEGKVDAWLKTKGRGKPFFDSTKSDNWTHDVDAAKLLTELFNDLTETRVSFKKMKHSVMLTEWIIKNAPDDLDELRRFLGDILK